MSSVSLGYAVPSSPHERELLRQLEWNMPALAQLTPGTIRRWYAYQWWMPAGSVLLVRVRSVIDGRYGTVLTIGPVAHHELDFVLGAVQVHEQPMTRRLVLDLATGVHSLGDAGAPVPEGVRELGHVEQSPLPMLDALERRILADGQEVLVSSTHDPLHGVSRTVERLGYIEACPLNPRERRDLRATWGTVPLWRVTDRAAWRHRYGAGGDVPAGGVALGAAWAPAGRGMTALRMRSDGWLETDAVPRPERGSSPLTTARWVAAPITWSLPPRGWSARAAASRARALRRRAPARAHEPAARTLGHLRDRPTPGWSPLFAATHPVLGDQFVTRSEIEARDLGYRVDGVLGFALDTPAVHAAAAPEVLWGSRFGHGRRTWEGPAQ